MMLADSASQLADLWMWNVPDDGNKSVIPARVAFASQPQGCCMMWQGGQTVAWWNQNYSQADLERAGRHQGGANVAYVDGHAKWIKWSRGTWGTLTIGLQ